MVSGKDSMSELSQGDNKMELGKVQSTSSGVSAVTVHRQSFQTGVFEFIPLPFFDDWLIVRERRLLVEKILIGRGVTFEKEVPKLLVDEGKRSLLGKLGGLVRALIVKPLRKILKTLLFWLAIRRAVLNVLETYFLARFASLEEVNSDAGPLTKAQAEVMGRQFSEVVKKLDQRFAKEGSRRLWQLMRQKKLASGENLSRTQVEEELEKEAPGILADFDRRMREALAEKVGSEMDGRV